MVPHDATALRCVGGAVVGFDLPAADLDVLARRIDYAVDGPTERAPTIVYRLGTERGDRDVVVRHDPRRHAGPEHVGRGLDDLIDDLHIGIAVHATEDVFVHAGVVAWQGVAIVVPGRSHAGKSTLVEALVRAGATYLSDEYARVTADGTIAPYPRPIQRRTATGRHTIDPREIGTVADGPHPPGLVVVTRHVRDAAFDPRPMSPAQAALSLFDNTVIAELDPVRAMAAVAGVARRSIAVRGDRPDVGEVVPAILALADKMAVA